MTFIHTPTPYRTIKSLKVSFSILNAFRNCGHFIDFRYIQGHTPVPHSSLDKGDAREFGTLIHSVVQEWLNTRDEDQVWETFRSLSESMSLRDVEASKLRSLHHAQLLTEAFLREYLQPQESFGYPYSFQQQPGLEGEYSLLLQDSNPRVELVFHTDGLLNFPGKLPYLLEIKTSSGNLNNELTSRMLPNRQILTYYWGLRQLGLDLLPEMKFLGLCTYRPMVNPGYKYKGRGEEKPLFLIQPVQIPSWSLPLHERWLEKNIQSMISDIETLDYSDNAPDSCTLWNSKCPFIDVCNSAPADRSKKLDLLFYKGPRWKGFACEFTK